MTLSSFQGFKHPLFLLLLVPLFFFVFQAYLQMMRKTFSPRFRMVLPGQSSKGVLRGILSVSPRFWHVLGYSLGVVFIILALARPQASTSKVHRTVEGIDIMLVLDISASMRIEDFRGQNRIDTAKEILREFIQGRESDKIGLEIFSGEPVTLVPPTLDYSLLLQSLKHVEIGDLKDGTAIGDALAVAAARLKTSTAKSRIIVLVTDGDSNVGQVDPLTAGDVAKGYGIRVYSVAIGTEGRVAMPFIQKDIFGRQVKTYQYFDNSINPDLIHQIADTTGGKFYRVKDDVKTFRAVFKDINQLEKRKIESTEQVRYEERFMSLLQFGMLIVALTFILQHTALRVYP